MGDSMADEVQETSESTITPKPNLVQPRMRRSPWMFREIEASLNLVPDEAEKHYSLAVLDVMLGKFNDAINKLETAIQANPEHTSALYLLGELYLKIGEHKKAANLLEKVVNNDPEDITAITWLCLAYHCLGHKGKAMAQQSVLQSIAPDLYVSVLNK